MDWINVAQDRNKWRTVVHVVTILRFPENACEYRLVDELAACEDFCSLKLLNYTGLCCVRLWTLWRPKRVKTSEIDKPLLAFSMFSFGYFPGV